MQSVSNDNFGPLVAYLIPGATVLAGFRPYFPLLQNWFAALPPDEPTIGGFLCFTLASLAAGMTVSAASWVLIDKLHELPGLRAPILDFSKLDGRVDALTLLIEIHYRHYQFYANMFVATAFAYVGHLVSASYSGPSWFDAAII